MIRPVVGLGVGALLATARGRVLETAQYDPRCRPLADSTVAINARVNCGLGMLYQVNTADEGGWLVTTGNDWDF